MEEWAQTFLLSPFFNTFSHSENTMIWNYFIYHAYIEIKGLWSNANSVGRLSLLKISLWFMFHEFCDLVFKLKSFVFEVTVTKISFLCVRL